MIKKLLIMVTIFGLTAFVGGGTVFAQSTTTDPNASTSTSLFSSSKDAACGGAQASDSPVNCDTAKAGTTVDGLIKTGLNILSVIIGVAAVIMIIIGGFKFVTSQGESANIASARNTILYAIIGLVVVALAQFIVFFVLAKLNPKPPAPAKTGMMQEVNRLDNSHVYVV